MLIKYIVILYFITSDCNYSLSIREDIELARKFLKYHGIPDKDLCKKENINKLCSSDETEVCSARLWGKKMEFKQFDNPCYMDLSNFCESQDSIWAIKNSGPCKMNAEMRRFAKDIEKIADSSNTTDGDKTTEDDDEVTYETTTDENESVTESTNNETDATESDDVTEGITYETTTDETEVTDEIADDVETETTDEIKTTIEIDATENATDAKLRMGDDEIGRIFYDDGSVKAVLREASSRFPPMRAQRTWNKQLCEKLLKPCPNIYYPMCLYYMKESPNNVTYYHFINKCEAQQYTCYHPEHKVEGISSMRAGYCAHIQYINYARFIHTMSAWGHYGWLHGPWPFNHILKPHERG